MRKTVAIMTGGGDAPGLNAVIRAVVKRGVSDLGWRVIGIEDSFDGLLEDPWRIRELGRDDVRGILRHGGTILGTTNRGDPFMWRRKDGTVVDRSKEVADAFERLGVEGLIGIGGDGTMRICWTLMKEHGVPVIGVPKTIDNDIPLTDVTFGFDSAMSYATDAVDRLHATAESHDRVMILEVMGRDAGFIALHSGIAGGADVVLIPEIPFRMESVCAKIRRRKESHRLFSIMVVAEGARSEGQRQVYTRAPGSSKLKLGGIGRHVAEAVAQHTGLETRFNVLGHLQRGGGPTPHDRILATRFGNAAVDLVLDDAWGRMAAFVGGEIGSVPLKDVSEAEPRRVQVEGDLLRAARGLGIAFGDEPVGRDERRRDGREAPAQGPS